MRIRNIALLILLAASLIQCAGSGPTAASGSNSPTATGSISDMVDHSVNNASVDLLGDELVLTTIATPQSPIGAFVGGGRGNKVLAGMPDYHRFALSQLESIAFESKNVSASGYMYLNLIVDLDCQLNESASATIADLRANRKVLVVNTFTETAKDSGYTSYAIAKGDAHWLQVGGGALPANEPGAPLSAFLSSHPNACIVNSTSADGGLPREVGTGCQTGAALATTAPGYCGRAVSGILFILGDSTTLTQNNWKLRKVTVNNKAYGGL